MKLICLVGPTASGKTALALELADRFGGEIVSADSRQICRGLDIGTAKPTRAEQARARHHCLDLVEPGEPFDAARFRGAAEDAIADIRARGRVPLVVGGTGLYLRALLRGLCPAPPRVPALRAAMAGEEIGALHARLGRVDPESARRVGPRDRVRIVRALEVALATGVPLSRWQAEHGFRERRHDALVIGLARPTAELDARIRARVDAMVAAGLLDEVRAVAARGILPDALGYREMLACLEGRTDLATAVRETVLATRRFAKRQRTWFRREPGIVWRHPEHEAAAIHAAVADALAGAPVPLDAPA